MMGGCDGGDPTLDPSTSASWYWQTSGTTDTGGQRQDAPTWCEGVGIRGRAQSLPSGGHRLHRGLAVRFDKHGTDGREIVFSIRQEGN